MKTYKIISCFWRRSIALLLALLPVLIHAQVTISGTIRTPIAIPVEGVTVLLTGDISGSTETDENGYYEFEVPNGSNVQVIPQSSEDYINGVDMTDVWMIRSWIFAMTTFTSPYQSFAADINNSQGVSTFDLVGINKLIESNDPSVFYASWRYIPADFEFENVNFPLPEDPGQTIELFSVSENTIDIDFVAVKLGDVNFDAIPHNLPSGTIYGSVFWDENGNCEREPNEIGFTNWPIVASGNYNAYDATRDSGVFNFLLLTGDYDLELTLPNPYWAACSVPTEVEVLEDATTVINYAMQPAILCPELNVDVSAIFLRRCFDNNYTVTYCNQGTAVAEDAYLELSLDPFFTMVSSELAYTDLGNNLFRFDLGDVPVAACESFKFAVNISCEAELGQTHCVEAHIFPDTICIPTSPLWDGSSLTVDASCDGDTL